MKIRPFLLAVMLLLSSFFHITTESSAQTPNWKWATGCINSGSKGTTIATDAWNNVIISGNFMGDSIQFDSTTLRNNTSAGLLTDFILAKFNSNGNVLWAKAGGGKGYDEITTVSCDKQGNIIVAGNFASDSIEFDGMVLHRTGITNVFIAKLDSSGNIIWLKSAQGQHSANILNSCTDSTGNIFICGRFEPPSISFDSITILNSGNWDAFFVKFDSLGNGIFAKSARGNSADYFNSITLDLGGNIVVGGNFNSSQIIVDSDTLFSSGFTNFLISKYNTYGNYIWSKSFGNSGDVTVKSIGCDNQNNIACTGSFLSPSLSLGPIQLMNTSNTNDPDLFVFKLDTSGNSLWAHSATDIYADFAEGIAIDSSNNIIVTGSYHGSSITFGNHSLTNLAGNFNPALYIVKYNSIGNIIWSEGISLNVSLGGIQPSDIVSDNNDDLIITGDFANASVQFGSITLPGSSSNNLFVSKLSDFITSIPILDSNSIIANYYIFNNVLFVKSVNATAIEIYNITGKLLYAFKFSTSGEKYSDTMFDLGNFKNGIYFIRLFSNQSSKVFKFIFNRKS